MKGLLRHRKLYGYVYIACESIKRNGKTCLFAEPVFRSTYFWYWKHIAADFESFVLSTLEKYHQISRSGPWSATYDLGWIKLGKICFENLPFTCLQVLFLKARIHRVFNNYFRPRWKPLVDAHVGDSRARLLSEVFERKADYFILTTSSEKT